MKAKLNNTALTSKSMANTTANTTTTSTSFVRVGVLAGSLLASLMIASPASAASACKGLDSSACSASASCGWVDSYQRKDGRTVKAFCRTKSGAKKSAAKGVQTSKVTKKKAAKQSQKSIAKNGG